MTGTGAAGRLPFLVQAGQAPGDRLIHRSRALAAPILAILVVTTVASAASAQGTAPKEPARDTKGIAAGPKESGSPPAARSRATASPADDSRSEIEWLDWGPEAFRKAILRDRPILLNLVVTWSRQCRDMEETWRSRKIADLVNSGFVPIRVDADRRPDIRERYSTSAWPSITLVFPNGMPFYAAREGSKSPARVALGFLPPDRLAPVLEEALAVFRDKSRRGMIKKTVEDGMKAEAEPKLEGGALDPLAPQKTFEALRANFDALNGGWTKAPKFPMTAPIDACLTWYSSSRDARALEVAERAIHAVTDGPLFDRVDGGVHRLSTGEDWTHPEYEKLLDRNVAMLDSLLSAYVLTGKSEYADRARDIIRFLETRLRRSGGGYFASQSSDPSSKDGGAYYTAPEAVRAKMTPPRVDTLVLTGWSAKAAAAELRAASLLGRAELVPTARETLGWLLSSAWTRGRGVVHGLDAGTAILPAFLEDQVSFTEGMLDAFQFTGDKKYLAAAKDTALFTVSNLRDGGVGLFGDIIPNPADPMTPFRTAVHPYDANCRMARVLARLFYLNPLEKSFRSAALGVLEAYSTRQDKGPSAAFYSLALAEYREGPLWTWVIGNDVIPGTAALRSAANGIPQLWKIVVTLDPADPLDAESIQQMGFVLKKPPAVYFSSGTHTSKPALFPQEVPLNYKALSDLLLEEKAKAEQKRKNAQGSVQAGDGSPSGGRDGSTKPH